MKYVHGARFAVVLVPFEFIHVFKSDGIGTYANMPITDDIIATYKKQINAVCAFYTWHQSSHGPLTRNVKLRVRMRRECQERFPRQRG